MQKEKMPVQSPKYRDVNDYLYDPLLKLHCAGQMLDCIFASVNLEESRDALYGTIDYYRGVLKELDNALLKAPFVCTEQAESEEEKKPL